MELFAAFIASFTPTEITASVILSFVIILVLTGKLVPESIYKDVRKRADEWKEAHDEERKLRVQLMRELSVSTETGKTVQKISEAIRENLPLGADDEEQEKDGG